MFLLYAKYLIPLFGLFYLIRKNPCKFFKIFIFCLSLQKLPGDAPRDVSAMVYSSVQNNKIQQENKPHGPSSPSRPYRHRSNLRVQKLLVEKVASGPTRRSADDPTLEQPAAIKRFQNLGWIDFPRNLPFQLQFPSGLQVLLHQILDESEEPLFSSKEVSLLLLPFLVLFMQIMKFYVICFQ